MAPPREVDDRKQRRATARAWLRVPLALAALFATAAPALAQPALRVESDARALEERLHAPCCRGQLLDAHESPAVSELRREIRVRLSSGESPAAVEQGLVRRYGASIVAVPATEDPRFGLSWLLGISLALSACALLIAGRRWARTVRHEAATADPLVPDAFDARLELELQRFGD